ncbi:MAG: 50S ribosomal protein L5 [Planctomycetaceae bacterium]|nr:50S ribosomal protein L5 [Planctomycetaceae bacterium]
MSTPRLQQQYQEKILGKLAADLGRTNPHALPRLEKIVVSMGVGKSMQDRKLLEEAVTHLARITGQQPQITRSRRSIAQFKLRVGMEVGCRVTLRKHRMYEFLDRLISLALPRVRDFRGVNPKAFDGRGNFSLGLNEQVVFPEINADNVKSIQGMNITMVTSTTSDEEARALLTEFGIPFRKDLN